MLINRYIRFVNRKLRTQTSYRRFPWVFSTWRTYSRKKLKVFMSTAVWALLSRSLRCLVKCVIKTILPTKPSKIKLKDSVMFASTLSYLKLPSVSVSSRVKSNGHWQEILRANVFFRSWWIWSRLRTLFLAVQPDRCTFDFLRANEL